MGRVESLERARTERLADTLVAPLRERGQAFARIADVDDVGRWRRAAVLAGHRLGLHVRTLVAESSDLVAYVTDRPVSMAEQREGLRLVTQVLAGGHPRRQSSRAPGS